MTLINTLNDILDSHLTLTKVIKRDLSFNCNIGLKRKLGTSCGKEIKFFGNIITLSKQW